VSLHGCSIVVLRPGGGRTETGSSESQEVTAELSRDTLKFAPALMHPRGGTVMSPMICPYTPRRTKP